MSIETMPTTDFGIIFDGPGLTTGQMPVNELAPSLLSLGQLFTQASIVLYPERKPATLSVTATREGSFAVHLILAPNGIWDQVVDIFSGDAATAILQLKEFIAGGAGLLYLITKLRGRKIEPRSVEAGVADLVIDDQNIRIPVEVLKLYESVEIRRRGREFVDPLTSEGIDEVSIINEGETTVRIGKGDVSAFDIPTGDEEVLLDEEVEQVLSISAIAFAEGHKWKFDDGQSSFYARIDDDAFTDRVDKGIEAFRSGDLLRCRVRMTQIRRPTGLFAERRITRVIHHIPADVQLELGDGEAPT